jgi:hypothetical protein
MVAACSHLSADLPAPLEIGPLRLAYVDLPPGVCLLTALRVRPCSALVGAAGDALRSARLPLLVLTLIHYFCVSPGKVLVERSAISEVSRKGAELSFLARLPSGDRRARLRAKNEAEAAEIAQRLAA